MAIINNFVIISLHFSLLSWQSPQLTVKVLQNKALESNNTSDLI